MEAPINVLYVEDDPGTAELLRNHLLQADCIVTLASDGERGIALCSTRKFDVVLIDHTLPGMTGLDILRQLREVYETPPAMIMLTGTGDEQIAVEAMRAGADDYIIKDVAGSYFELIIRVIHRVLDQRDLRRNHERLLIEQSRLIEELQAFSYAVAHDLKQPITVLLSSVGLLERFIKIHDEDRTQQKLTSMYQTINQMDDTLNALILFARIRETATIELEPINMRDIVTKVIKQLEDTINKSGALISVQEEMPKAVGYAPWIERIWINYLTNAIKYGGVPPQVRIGATTEPNGVISYWVKDNGEGLTSADLEKLFVPFSRLREQRAEGHGLGLSIVSLIARKLGGEAKVVSKPEEGTIFSFTLHQTEEN